MIDDSLIYSGTIPDERLHDMCRDLRSPMGGGRGGSGGSGPRGAGVFLVDSVFTRSQDDTYHADKSLFLNPLDKASYGVRIGDIVLFYLNNEGILCTGVVMAISNDDVTFKKHDEISTVGFSPSIATTDIPGGHRVTVTNEGGSDSFDVMDGVQGPQGEPFEFDDFTLEQLDELRSGVASVYYRKQEASVINFSDMDTIEIPFDNFTFADMLFVDIEGLMLTENQDYVINGSTIELTTPITHQGTRINFKLLTIMAITSEDLDTLLEGLADFNGATDSAAGTHGLVPAPAAGDDLDVLFGNGEWGSLGLTTFSWGNDQSISIQANFDNEHAPAALFGSTSLPLASATRAGLMKLEDYSKLQGIQAGAQANVIESISVNGTAVDVNNKNAAISIPQASSDSAGLMAASDKTKLDTISAFDSDDKAALFADGMWWHLFNEMTSNGHLLLKRGRSTGGSTPTPIIQTIDDMPMPAASEYMPGLMTVSDKVKLDGIEAGANAYTLPAATTATLGGVKPDGTTVTVDNDGTIHATGGGGGTIPDGSITGPKIANDTIPDSKLAQTGGVLSTVQDLQTSAPNNEASWVRSGMNMGVGHILYPPVDGSSTTRLTVGIAEYKGESGIFIECDEGYMYRLAYVDSSNVCLSDSLWVNGPASRLYNDVPSGTVSYCVVVRNVDDSDITVDERSHVRVYASENDSVLASAISDMDLKLTGMKATLSDVVLGDYGTFGEWALGLLSVGTSENFHGGQVTASTTRIYTTTFITVPQDRMVRINAADEMKYRICFYKEKSENVTSTIYTAPQRNWSEVGETYTEEAPSEGNYFRICAAFNDNRTMVPSDGDAISHGTNEIMALDERVTALEDVIAGDYAGKVISILGDSISTFAGYIPEGNRARYPQSDLLTDVDDTYWMRLIRQFDLTLGINESWAGSRVSWDGTTEGQDVGADKYIASMTRIGHLDDNGTPDMILVNAGTNDIGASVTIGTFDTTSPDSLTDNEIAALPVATFADAYRALLIRLQKYYPTSQILVMLPNYTSTYYSVSKADEYCEVVKEVCDYFGVKWIDIRTSGITMFNRATYLPDGIHPNAAGMNLLYKNIAKFMAYNFTLLS